MAEVSRRSFLRSSGLAVATAGMVSQIPGLTSLVGATGAEAPAVTDSAVVGADEEAATMSEPLVAHVRDLSTGEIGIFNGLREVVYHDPELAARLFRAVR